MAVKPAIGLAIQCIRGRWCVVEQSGIYHRQGGRTSVIVELVKRVLSVHRTEAEAERALRERQRVMADEKPGRLVLGRRPGESILIYPAGGGPPIMVELVAARKGYGRLGIIAPKDWRIERVGVAIGDGKE